MNIGRIIITLHNPEEPEDGRLMESNCEFWASRRICKICSVIARLQILPKVAIFLRGSDPGTIFIVCREKSRVQIESDKWDTGPGRLKRFIIVWSRVTKVKMAVKPWQWTCDLTTPRTHITGPVSNKIKADTRNISTDREIPTLILCQIFERKESKSHDTKILLKQHLLFLLHR